VILCGNPRAQYLAHKEEITAAISMFTNPSMLVAFVAAGSAIERGTEPSAAWCRTMSTPAQAARQCSGLRTSPSMKR